MIKFWKAWRVFEKSGALGKLFEFLKKDKVVMKKTRVSPKTFEKNSWVSGCMKGTCLKYAQNSKLWGGGGCPESLENFQTF